ncbi:MAG TPA: TatD family hydrolase [Thermoanaerobaculia bacterium]|nr:TatD family hydrolase [Thermoanaerobaculia bacterium]
MTRFADSHCHLTMSDAKGNLARAREQGVAGFVVPGTKLDDAGSAVKIAQANDDVWAAVGFHPHEAKDCGDAAFATIERLAREARVVAVGEIGLDYHYMHSPRDAQREVFMRHVALANQLDLPVIVHNRESTDDLVELLTSDEAKGARGILHSYTESLDVARKLIDLGYFISFSGIVTFRSADSLRGVARALPHDRVLIETDTPYLAPVPFRGRQNEPAYVVKVAELLASLWGRDIAEVAEQTTANFESAFRVRLPR